jgi:hypothetical protein
MVICKLEMLQKLARHNLLIHYYAYVGTIFTTSQYSLPSFVGCMLTLKEKSFWGEGRWGRV